MPTKKGESVSATKQDKKKVNGNAPAEATEKKTPGAKKHPKRAETYSVYIYRVLK